MFRNYGSCIFTLKSLLCPQVVVVVGLERFDDLWSNEESLMSNWSKVRFQTKTDGWVYAVCGRLKYASGTHLLIRRDSASEPATA